MLLMFMGGGILNAQTISGTVKDATGEGVIGATIMEQGTTNGTVTDFDGNFTLKLTSSKNPIVVSYVGMKTQTINVDGRSTIDVLLEDESTTLNELVVIGYGAVKKKDLTGSVATVGSDALVAVPVASATEALTGKMAGVQITTTEGSPDAEMSIRVRGGGSITQSNEPLFIVDGFPVESINDIPATDIEDITVLKDASSTAIYGSRGANGVILVTTKSGKEGKVKVSYNAYYSWKKIAKTLDVLSPAQYARWQYEYALLGDKLDNFVNHYGNPQDLDLYENAAANEWQDITFGRTGHTFNHNININGGSENIKYAFSYAHMNDQAIMQGSNFKRDNMSLKLNTKPTKRTTLDLQARYSETDIRGGGANDATSTSDTDKRLKYSVLYTPIPVSDLSSDSEDESDDLGNLYNPLVALRDNDRKQTRRSLNMAGSFGWEIFKNFKAKTEFGYDKYDNYDQRFFGLTTYYIRNNVLAADQGKPAISLADTDRHRFRSTNTVTYDFKDIFKNSDHSLNVMAGHEYVITKKRINTDNVDGFPVFFNSADAWRLTGQGNRATVNDIYSADDKLLSWFGRANYNFADKYLLSFTFRADASSKFSEDNRWGYFPSAAIAWRISSEPFMKGTENWLDDLKLRFSYGTAGNNNIPVGQTTQEFRAITSKPYVNGFPTVWAPTESHMANPDLKWETTITRNLGLDFTLLRGKLTGSLEAYINTTKDLLIDFPTGGSGYDNQYRNMGKTENRGFEATITWNAINKKDYGLSFNANIGFNKNEVKDLGARGDFGFNSRWASTQIGNDYLIAVGNSVGKMIGYRNDGRYEVSDFDWDGSNWTLKEGIADDSGVVGRLRPGMLKLVDIDGDYKVDSNDIVEIGDANPAATGGFGISARAYGFDLTANFNFSIGNDVYNANKVEFTSTGGYQYRNMIDIMAEGKRWTNIDPLTNELCNDPARLAELNVNTTMWSPYMSNMVFSDWAVEDASFLRLNTLTLGYTLPETLTRRVGINSLRFYVTGYNVFCITSYSGYDPEVSTIRRNGNNLTPGVDYSAYPKSRQLVVGLNLNF